MNHINQLEKHLRSWKPRRPSDKVRTRIFSAHLETADLESSGVLALKRPGNSYLLNWHWLAPAMALFVLTMTFLGRGPGPFNEMILVPSNGLVATMALNEPHLAFSSRATYRDHNVWPSASFEWTNRGHSLTTAPSLFDTNGFVQ